VIALVLSTALLAGEPGLRLDAQVVGLARGQTLRVKGEDPVQRLALDVTPRLSLTVATPAFSANAAYGVRLLAPDLLERRDVDVVHLGQLHAEWRLRRGQRLFTTAVGAYGRTDLVTGSSQTVTELEQVPTTGTVAFIGAQVEGGVAWQVGPRDDVRLSTAWYARGGADAESRRSIPLQRGLRLDGAWSRLASHRDTIAALLSVTTVTLDPGGEGAIARLGISWRRRLTSALEGRAGAGGAVTWSPAPGGGVGVRPSGELGLARASPLDPLDADLSLRAVPFLDSLTGAYEERLEGLVRVRWRLVAPWALAAEASAGRAPWRAGGDALTSRAEVRVERGVSSRVSLAAGLSGVWQRSYRPDLLTFAQYGIFVSFARTPRP